jgi:uncharacterized iron-regulated membrane protein
MRFKPVAVLAFLLAATASSTSFAVTSNNAESSASSGATVSVAEAVAAVEANGQGKVVELALAGSASAPVYNVTVQMPDGTESNFTVDAKTGKVAASADVADNQGGAVDPAEPEDGNRDDSTESGEGGSN